MFWIILISVIIATLMWILLGPVILCINTENNRYFLSLPGILSTAVVPDNKLFHLRVWIFFIPFTIHPFRLKERKKKTVGKKANSGSRISKKNKKPFDISRGMKMGQDVLKVVRVRTLRLDIDTDDFLLNSWLIPAFSALNTNNIQMQVNFEGNASFLLDVRTTLGSLIWTFIKHKYK